VGYKGVGGAGGKCFSGKNYEYQIRRKICVSSGADFRL
jgi:hypothetical protein